MVWYNRRHHEIWYSLVVHGWAGGPHVMDDFGNAVAVSRSSTTFYFP